MFDLLFPRAFSVWTSFRLESLVSPKRVEKALSTCDPNIWLKPSFSASVGGSSGGSSSESEGDSDSSTDTVRDNARSKNDAEREERRRKREEKRAKKAAKKEAKRAKKERKRKHKKEKERESSKRKTDWLFQATIGPNKVMDHYLNNVIIFGHFRFEVDRK